VAAALLPHVKTLTRPVHVWHYAQRGRIGLQAEGYVPPDAPEIAPYLRGRFARYWDLTLRPYEDGTVSGLYVAVDPVASRAWGGSGEAWALVQMVLPRGFRLVDVRTWGDERDRRLAFAPEVAARLSAAGCAAAGPAELLTLMESDACRAAAVRTMVDLDVDGILYDFLSKDLAGCPPRGRGGFILVRAEAVDLAQAKLLVRETEPGPGGPADAAAEDRRRVVELFAAARAAGSTRPLPWPELATAGDAADAAHAADAADDHREWMAEHLFGCGSHAEDRMPEPGSDPLAAAREAAARDAASPQARYRLGAALAAAGRDAEAAAEHEEALRLEPDHVEALAELAWLRATSGDPGVRDGARAVALAERLVGLSQYRHRFAWPKITKTRHSMILAAAYAAAGNFPRALDYAHHALELAARQHQDSATPLTAALHSEAERRLALYQAGQPYRPPREAAPASAAASAAEALAPLVEILDRPIYVWHWLPRARAGLPPGYLPPDSPALGEFLAARLARWWDLSLPVMPLATASGLWAGIDPVIGRHFGGAGEDWAVVQIELPAGLRVLDVRAPAGGAPPPLPPAARERLAAAGCAAALAAALVMGQESAACRAAAVAAVRALGVGARLADFPRFAFRECGPARREGVFVLLDPGTLAPGRLRLLTRESAADAALPDRLRIRALFARARDAGSSRALPWPELAAAPPPEDLDAWMREHLLGCDERPGDPSSPEEARP
jgi:tetratricopeptide (TPR) repeat protein